MKHVKAFEIIKSEALADGKWIVKGRAYADIYVGDYLTLEEGDQGINQYKKFKVESITTYGRSTPVLSTVMTGNLIINCEGLIELNDDTFLYKTFE